MYVQFFTGLYANIFKSIIEYPLISICISS